MELLRCTRCKKEKPATREFFPYHNRRKSGFDSWCKACRSAHRGAICRGRFRAFISDEALKRIKEAAKHCAICKQETKLVVDHDHASGKIRGMLCRYCNLGLGHFKDSSELLRAAAKYLRRG